MVDIDRRKVLKACATLTTGGVISGIAGALATETWRTIWESKDVGEIQKNSLNTLFPPNNLPSIYAGTGNPLGIIDNGIKKLSSYLEFSSSSFSSYIQQAYNLELDVTENNNHFDFNYDIHKSALFLGGPVANDYVKRLLGYSDRPVVKNGIEINLPTPDLSNKRLRWVQLHGEENFGIYNGQKEFAKRYDQGKLVERAIYKLYDKRYEQTFDPSLNSEGFLEKEWLTIVKLNEHNSSKVIIGGMHGYSTEAFSRNIGKNLQEIERISQGLDQFQIVVPVNLSHKVNLTGKPYTIGDINWKKAKIEKITA